MRMIYPALLSALLLPTLSLAQSISPPAMSAAAQATSGLSAQDKSFVKNAAQAGMAEVQQGQLAQSNGGAAVQSLAAMMVADHTKANDQLKAIAAQLGAIVPATVSTKDAMMTQQLKSLHGASFDSKYLHGQKLAHEKAIMVFTLEIASGSNAQLKSFAQQTLPVLKGHLRMIEKTPA